MYGLRACIAVMRIFLYDSEVLDLCTSCLLCVISDHEYNRDGLAGLSLPMPPMERTADMADAGWAFLRAALDAFIVQGGGTPYEEVLSATAASQSVGLVRGGRSLAQRCWNTAVAMKVAKCIVACAPAPAMAAQFALLQQPCAADCCDERREACEMLAEAVKTATSLLASSPNDPALLELQRLLTNPSSKPAPRAPPIEEAPPAAEEVKEAVRIPEEAKEAPETWKESSASAAPAAAPAPPPEAEQPPPTSSSRFGSLASGVRGFLGR